MGSNANDRYSANGWNTGAIDTSAYFEWELTGNVEGVPGVDFDQLIVAGGDLNLATGVTLDLRFEGDVDWTDPFWSSGHSWTIINMSGGGAINGMFTMSAPSTWLDSNGVLVSDVNSLASFTVGVDGGNVVLDFVLIPEPSTLFLLAGGAAVVFGRRRRVSR